MREALRILDSLKHAVTVFEISHMILNSRVEYFWQAILSHIES